VKPSISEIHGSFGTVPVAVATSEEVQSLPLRALRVYLVLLARFNVRKDGWTWSMAALARDTGIHRDHISEAVRRLEEAGLLEVARGAGLTASHYRLTVPPSMMGEGAKSAPTVGAKSAPSPPELAPGEGAKPAPTGGANSAPPLHRDHTEDLQKIPPTPPRGEKAEEPSADEEEEMAHDLGESPTRGDLVRQLARDMGIRPREARKVLERREHIAADERPPAPPLKVKQSHLEELRALGWLTAEQEAACAGHLVEDVPRFTPVPAVSDDVTLTDAPPRFDLPPRLAHRARQRAAVDA
jgi:hypothetical protein